MKQAPLVATTLVALVTLLSVSPDVHAQGAGADYRITAPTGWTEMAGQSKAIRAALLRDRSFDGVAVDVAATAWLLTGQYSSLVVSALATQAPVSDAPGAVRRQLDRVRAAVGHADLKAGTTHELAWTEALRDGAAEANLEWRHDRNGTLTLSRTLIYPVHQGGGTGVRQVSAECVMSVDTVAAMRPTCEAALATLVLTLPLEPRVPLTELPVGSAAPTTTATITNRSGALAADSRAAVGAVSDADRGPSMSETGSGAPPPRMIVVPPKAEDKDHRLLYVIGGLLLIGGLWFALRYKRLGLGPGARGDDDGAGRDADDDALDRAGGVAKGGRGGVAKGGPGGVAKGGPGGVTKGGPGGTDDPEKP